jgi:hypothetical protein
MARSRSGTKLKVYYAHCIALYNTKQESRDVQILQALGFQVINPNAKKHDVGAKKYGMAYFEKFADECDLIVFRALPHGDITGGVGQEIEWFQERNKPVIELPSLALRRVLTKEISRVYLKEVGTR